MLIVDDSRTVRAVLKRSLVMAGFGSATVHEAENGTEALKALDANKFDVVLSDIHMPEMDGTQLVTAMRIDPRFAETPVVVISSDTTESRRDIMLGLGVKSFVHKPFRAEDLRDILRGILEGSRS